MDFFFEFVCHIEAVLFLLIVLDVLEILVYLLHPTFLPLHFLRKRRDLFLITVIFISEVVDKLLLSYVSLSLMVN